LIQINDRDHGSAADHGRVANPAATTSGLAAMAETTKLSVEKALNKLRKADAPKSRGERRDDDIAKLDEEIERMRAQRLRLEAHQRKKRD
jgi:hypothetical protein